MPTEAERKAQSQKDKSLHKKSLKVVKKSHVKPPKPKSTSAPVARASFRHFTQENSKRIVDREFVANVGSQDTLAYAEYRCNPGDFKTFPRLGIIAQSFDQYRFHKLRFVYEARVGTLTGGTVILSPEYDSTESPVTITEATLMNTRDARDGVLWEDLVCDMNPAAMFAIGPRKFVSRNVRPNRSSVDAGLMRVGTQQSGATAIAVAGKLWVEYDVEFFVPCVDNFTGVPMDRFVFEQPAPQSLTTGLASALLFAVPTGLMSYLTYDPLTGLLTCAVRCKLMMRWRVNINCDGITVPVAIVLSTFMVGTPNNSVTEGAVIVETPLVGTRKQYCISNIAYVQMIEGNTVGVGVQVDITAATSVLSTLANLLEVELIQ